MEAKSLSSFKELTEELKKQKRSYLLLYKKNSSQSESAQTNYLKAISSVSDIGVYMADVGSVKDIHPVYTVTTVPALLEFQGDQLQNIYRGAHDTAYYNSLFEGAVYTARTEKAGKKVKNVTVYTTPSCSWCMTLKSYLRKNGVRFSEIDVSKDENAAREMLNKSGQKGVPQTSVNGSMVIGFDRQKLDRLLEIKDS